MKIKIKNEQKYYCFNPKKMVEKIQNMGFIGISKSNEKYEYFTDTNCEFIDNINYLRICQSDDQSIKIDFNLANSSVLDQRCKLKENMNFDVSEYNNLVNLFILFGFYPYCKFEKETLIFFKKNINFEYVVSIDILPNIGGFIEVEISSDKKDISVEKLKIELRKFVDVFLDCKLYEETRAYRDIVADYILKINKFKIKTKNIYICLDNFLIKYEKNFYKKYKDKFIKDYKKKIKWGMFRKDVNLNSILDSYIEEYLNNMIFDSKELLITLQLLSELPQNKIFITKTNKVFFSHLFERFNIKRGKIIYSKDETINQLIKKNRVDLKESLIINEKDLRKINSVLLVIKNKLKSI